MLNETEKPVLKYKKNPNILSIHTTKNNTHSISLHNLDFFQKKIEGEYLKIYLSFDSSRKLESKNMTFISK